MTNSTANPNCSPASTEGGLSNPVVRTKVLPRPSQRRFSFSLLTLFVVTGATVALGVMTGIIPVSIDGSHSATANASSDKPPVSVPTAKVARPKLESSAEIVLERIASIEPYFRADLRARASGIVKAVHHDIGESVQRGEILIEIDVSEYEQDVAQKEALIVQRQQELKVSDAKLKDAQAAQGVTAAAINQKLAEVQSVTATRDLKKGKLQRYEELAATGTVVGSLVEEETRDYKASEAALLAAEANVARARADHLESAAKVEAAAADVKLKQAQIEVARKDLDRSKVVADYGKVIAPFDGVVVKKNVDPGSFVQNATSGSSETLISISRIDLLTVVAQFPDNAAPYITEGTPATIQIAGLSGSAIFSTVTRFSPTIQNSDRTMRVEVDLFNGDSAARQKLGQSYIQNRSQPHLKGRGESLPAAAFATGYSKQPKLLPGMNGSIKLSFGGSGQAYVLPSTAVYSRSGVTYILVVKDGKTRQLPVRVHLNDGHKSRVSIVARKKRDDGTDHESLMDLRGDEDVVLANQLQFGENAEVHVSRTEW